MRDKTKLEKKNYDNYSPVAATSKMYFNPKHNGDYCAFSKAPQAIMFNKAFLYDISK